MKSRDVVGRRVTGVRQSRHWNAHLSEFSYTVAWIELEGGVRIVFHAEETEDCPHVTASVVREGSR